MSADSNQEVLARAEKVAAVFAEHAQEGEQRRELPPESLAAVKDAGLFKLLTPARFGGDEMDFDVIPHVARTLAYGDTASAWVTTFLIHHNWQFALYPLETQEEVWADGPWALGPATLAPTGTATKVDGGWEIDGRWQWGTGVQHSDWTLITAIGEGERGPEPLMVLLPLRDVEVVDVWHTDGMRATGSNDMVVDHKVVPDHYVISFRDIVKRQAPGHLINDNPLYRIEMLILLSLDATGTAVGTAERCLELFQDLMGTRRLAFIGTPQRDHEPSRIRLARAASIVRAIRLVFDADVTELCAPLHGGPDLTAEQRVRIRMDCAHILERCREVVNLIGDGSGASSHFLDAPVQRHRRDLLTMSGHALFDYDRAASLHGGMLLGDRPPPGTLL